MTTISSRDFNQDASAAKRAANREPVIITDRGRPSHVLMTIEEYRRLSADRRDIVDWLSVDDETDVEFEKLNLVVETPQL